MSGSLGTIDSASVVAATDIPDGCEAEADADGDSTYEGDVGVGAEYPAGTDFMLFCDLGTQDATGTVDLDNPSA